MELKRESVFSEATSTESSNRTFMELKHTIPYLKTASVLRSNRTFMELKLVRQGGSSSFRYVLIVPLWN